MARMPSAESTYRRITAVRLDGGASAATGMADRTVALPMVIRSRFVRVSHRSRGIHRLVDQCATQCTGVVRELHRLFHGRVTWAGQIYRQHKLDPPWPRGEHHDAV